MAKQKHTIDFILARRQDEMLALFNAGKGEKDTFRKAAAAYCRALNNKLERDALIREERATTQAEIFPEEPATPTVPPPVTEPESVGGEYRIEDLLKDLPALSVTGPVA